MSHFRLLLPLIFIISLTSCGKEKSVDEYIESAQTFLTNNDYRSAIIELKNAVKADPKNTEARVVLGKTYIDTLSFDAALKEFNRAKANGYSSEKLLPFIGVVYQNTARNDEILAEIKPSDLLSDAENAQIHSIRATAYLRLKQDDLLKKELDLAKKLDADQVNVRLAWGLYEASKKNTEQQLFWIKPLLEQDNPDAWGQMGGINQAEGKNERAESNYTNAINARKVVNLDVLKRALVRITLNKFDEALKDINMLKNAGIQFPIISHSEGVIAFHRGDLDLAQRKFDETLAQYASFPPSTLALAMTHFKKRNFASTITNLEQYLATDPNNLLAQITLATSLIESNQALKAITLLKGLKKKLPENYEVAAMLGSALLVDKKQDLGIDELKRAVRLNTKNADAHYRLGRALLGKKGAKKEAQNSFLRATELDPKLLKASLSLYTSYIELKDYNGAAEIANKMVKENPDESLAYNLLANIEIAQKNSAKAISIYKDTLKRFPNDSRTSVNLAQVYVRQEELKKAENLYKGVLVETPGDLKALIPLAVLASRDGRKADSEQYLKTAVKKNPKNLSPKLLLGSQYLKEKKFDEAIFLFQESSDVDQARAEVLIIKSKAKMGMKEYNHALGFLKKLTSLRPEMAGGHFLLGQTYGLLNKTRQMKEELETTLKLDPKHFAAALIMARLALVEKDDADFNKRLKALKTNFPNNPDVQFLEAKRDTTKANFSDALVTLESLLKSTPHTDIVMDIARNKWIAGDQDGAIAGVELWLSENKEDKKALFMLAQLYMDQKKYQVARDYYEKLNGLSPNNPIVLNNLAWLYKEVDVIKGVDYAKAALRAAPTNPLIMDTVADLLLSDNKAFEALKYSKQAAKERPNIFDIQLNYAKVLIANKLKEKAKVALQKAEKLATTVDQKESLKTVKSTL